MAMGLIDFKIENSSLLEEVKVISFNSFDDERGSIWTSFKSNELEGSLLPVDYSFKHDKFSTNKKNVLRGIHGDSKSWKLVSCPFGSIQQVVVDLRPDSTNFNKWISFELNELNRKAILLPPGFGNAFLVISDYALYHYKLAYLGEYFDVENQFSHSWNDPSINIQWQSLKPILSQRDLLA